MAVRLALMPLVLLAVLSSPAAGAGAIVADHTRTDLSAVPEAHVVAAKASLHVAYGHTSHGSQIISGMGASGGQELDEFMTGRGSTPGLFRWNAGGAGGALDLRDQPFSGAQDLGNPNRTAWAGATRNYLNAHPEVNVVMWSWCGQAETGADDIDLYLGLMDGLVADYPGVRFVFMTGHLTGSGPDGMLNLANERIRDHCDAHGRILYDFADIESYDPDGLTDYMALGADDNCDYDADGNGSRESNWALAWQATHAEGVEWWPSGAAHSQHLNGNRKGYAAWWLLAEIARQGVDPPPGVVPKVKRVQVVGGRRQAGPEVLLDALVKGPCTGWRAWEDVPGAVPPEFGKTPPAGGVCAGVPVTLSDDPGLPRRRTVCFQGANGTATSKIRRVRILLE